MIPNMIPNNKTFETFNEWFKEELDEIEEEAGIYDEEEDDLEETHDPRAEIALPREEFMALHGRLNDWVQQGGMIDRMLQQQDPERVLMAFRKSVADTVQNLENVGR